MNNTPQNRIHSVRRRWLTAGGEKERTASAGLAYELGLLPVTAALLYMRGCHTKAEADSFLSCASFSFHDPFMLRDMDKAVERIFSAVENGEKLCIYGDYDVDGVTSTTALLLYLRSKGARVGYYIPRRDGEGYGLSRKSVSKLKSEGYSLIITVDTGITAVEESEYAFSMGIDMVITDHHECHSIIPKASAVVNPRRADSDYPFRELAGVGVVFKLLCALESRFSPEKSNYEICRYICDEYSDLIAIGTVADVMPLIDENRLIVRMGLGCLEKNRRPGLVALLEKAGISLGENIIPGTKKRRADTSLIGYTVAPRLNAAGRIRDASAAVELLLTMSRSKAAAAALELCDINTERQEQERLITKQAEEIIDAGGQAEGDRRVIVLAHDGWHHGVIGIVASRITEKYNIPSILITFDGDNGKGSGRSVKGLNLVDALSSCSDLLVKFGGHELAAGLSIERGKVDEFRRAINEYAAEHMTNAEDDNAVIADLELKGSEITLRLARELSLLEPCGVANEMPVFLLRDAEITEVAPIGGGRHTRLTVRSEGNNISAVMFGSSPEEIEVFAGDRADILFNLSINDFMNNQSVQLMVRSIRMNHNRRAALDSQIAVYDGIANRKAVPIPQTYIPSRGDFAQLYNRLRRCGDSAKINLRQISRELTGAYDTVKLHLMLEIFAQAGLIELDRYNEDSAIYGIRLINQAPGRKVPLDESELYRQLLKARQ